MASFGPTIKSECGRRPGGFTRLTPEVLDWVKIASGMEDQAGIKSLGERIFLLRSSGRKSVRLRPLPPHLNQLVQNLHITLGDLAGDLEF